MTQQPPRILHNAKEHDALLKRLGVTALFPKVTMQVDGGMINRRALPPYAYNGAIVRWQGKLLLAYRYHEGSASTRLGVAELDDKFNVTACHALTLPGKSQEDPRWHESGGVLYMSYVESDWPANPPHCVVKFGRFDPWQLTAVTQPSYGRNDFTSTEKNWVFFASQMKSWFIYDSHPKHIVVGLHGVEHVTPGVRWRYGKIRGGCVVPWRGKLLRFFHSAVDGELPPFYRRYFMGALVMSADPPFAVESVMYEPLVRGSEDDDLGAMERSSCFHYKAKVVFPLGAIEHGDGWLVSCGVNDSHIALVRVTEKMLKL